MGLEERRARRLEQAEQLLASDLTVREWCRLNKVAESTMYHWLKVLRDREDPGRAAGGRNGWIEIDRKAAKAKVALAVRDGVTAAVAAPPAAATVGGGARFPSIRVSANGIGIEVPHGACESDVAAVMRAAMSL